MRKRILGAILFAASLAFLVPRPASATVSVSISYFQQELAPYGEWVVVSRYGRVWRPTVVAAGWRPYSYGEWIYTDYGWTWVSYDRFGDDCFHYGTWVWADTYGWCWEPGYVWSPAWVTWAYTDFYIGWAPVPASFDFAVTGYAGSPVVLSQSSYVFVPVNQFVGTNVSSAVVPATQNAGILTHAQKVTHFSVAGGVVHTGGPSVAFVERVSGKRVARASLGVAGHTIRPARIATAGVVSGKRVRVTAPARERVIAAKGTKAPATKAMKATRVKQAKALQKKEAKPSKLARAAPGKGATAGRVKSTPPKQASKMTAPSRGKAKAAPKQVARLERKEPRRAVAAKPREEKRTAMAAKSPRTDVRREKAIAPPREAAPRIVEKQRVNPPAPRAERREEGRIAAGAPRAEGPRPARAEGPPPRAEKPQPQQAPQGQPAPKKEKEKK
ncbi:MAG TPA: DUF6600 domain-containing protein [Thermoanaerobaculia bacterium]|nr:DUF6600 domain-containing protein [Thermoanaerobaculia bacterium]